MDTNKKWDDAERRLSAPKPVRRSVELNSTKDKVESRLENTIEEISEAMEGLASMASEGELPAGITSQDMDTLHSRLFISDEDLDDPDALTRSMNSVAPISMRWGTIAVKLEYAVSDVQIEYDRWVAEAKIGIEEALFSRSRKEGATANNSRPNKETVNSQFLILWSDDTQYKRRRDLLNDLKQCRDYVKVILKGIETFEDMLTNIGHMQRMMVDKGVITLERKGKNVRRRKRRDRE